MKQSPLRSWTSSPFQVVSFLHLLKKLKLQTSFRHYKWPKHQALWNVKLKSFFMLVVLTLHHAWPSCFLSIACICLKWSSLEWFVTCGSIHQSSVLKFGELTLHITKIRCQILVNGNIVNTFKAKLWLFWNISITKLRCQSLVKIPSYTPYQIDVVKCMFHCLTLFWLW